MVRKLLGYIVAVALVAACGLRSFAQTVSSGAHVAVTSVSSWPEGSVLKRGDKVEVTTVDMPGVPFPCKVKSVSPTQLICGRSRDAQLRAFDRKAVQSIVLEGHARRKVSVIAYAVSSSLVIGGLAAVLAGAPLPGVYLIYAGLSGFVVAGIAEHVENYRGPTDAKSIYVAAPAATAVPSPSDTHPAVVQPS